MCIDRTKRPNNHGPFENDPETKGMDH
jgi:hypothetical protein